MAGDVGKSRIEAILENMLGAENTILPPFSRNEMLLLEILEEGSIAIKTISLEEVDEIVDSIA